MGSGSNIDLCVIRKNDDVEHFRPYEKLIESGKRQKEYKYPAGTTPVLSTKVVDIVSEEVRNFPEARAIPEAMET